MSSVAQAPEALAPTLTYEQARDMVASPDLDVRVALAGRTNIAPEILYFLSKDHDATVRVTVAANPAAPAKANLLLASDDDESVREILAGKIADAERSGGLGRTPRQKSISREVLDRLSRDRLTAVRAAIADSLKNLPTADPDLINRLARDLEILVAAPILEHSPVLLDDDLLDIIRTSPVQGALAAIARRAYVDPRITNAIVASGDSNAITHLLYNANAHLQEHTLDSLINAAGDQPDWQPPLIHRPELAEPSIRRLAEIVAENLLDRLMEREDLSDEAVEDLREVVNTRLRARFGQPEEPLRPAVAIVGEDLPSPFDSSTDERFAPFIATARALHDRGKLTETRLTVALLTDDIDDLVAGLSVSANLNVRVVLDILGSQAPRAISALAWTGGLSARFALELQVKLGRIAADYAIKPGPNGDYTSTADEMRWQIEMYADG